MPLLYYWRGDNYERDLRFGAGFHLNQSSKRLHAVELGDSIWAFTRRRDVPGQSRPEARDPAAA